MSEPTRFADRIETVTPGVLHWTVHDDRIDFRSDAYAVASPEGTVLIDPLPLSEAALASLGAVRAICLTGAFHQRSGWRYRRRFEAPVHAPEGGKGLEEAPDVLYAAGERLPGGLRAVHASGPTEAHYVLLLDRPKKGGVLFCADLVMRGDEGPFGFCPEEHQEDPDLTRGSVRRLLDLGVEVLCPAHGAPLVTGGGAALLDALERDPRS